MAFKMKGSAFKLGNVATKSVLKQKSPLEQGVNTEKMAQRSRESEDGFLKKNLRKLLKGEFWKSEPKKLGKVAKVASSITKGIGTVGKSKLRKTKMEGGPKMKSPAKQKRVPKKSTNIDELMDTATKGVFTKTVGKAKKEGMTKTVGKVKKK